jgi:lipoprotein NlpI
LHANRVTGNIRVVLVQRLVLSFTIGLLGCSSSIACDDARGCVAEAEQAEHDERFVDAVTSYTVAMEFLADSAGLYNARGSAAFKAGDMAMSIADFDRAIELNPSSEPYHWQRGISHYYADRLDDCVAQFDLHRSVNPNDVENSAWHFLCVAEIAGVEKAREDFLAVSGDARVPMRQVAELFRGAATVADVIAAADRDGSSSARFYAHLYLGLYYETLDDTTLAAEHINASVAEDSVHHYMWHVARIHKELRGY